jgi:hypothetical protein
MERIAQIKALKAGDEVFNISSQAITCYARRMRVERTTPSQIITIDVFGRHHRYWRETGREVGPFTNNYLSPTAPEYAKEPRRDIGKKFPEIA